MIEKPILFKPALVREILAGKKTQTRRVVKQYIGVNVKSLYHNDNGNWYNNDGPGFRANIKCPYERDTLLWVRETWGTYNNAEYFSYRADYPANATGYNMDGHECDFPKWRPSIHMPKEAARLFLRVTDVRIERLQDISEEDAKAEGVTPALWYQPFGTKSEDDQHYIGDIVHQHINYRTGFAGLWDSLCGKKEYCWESNPWVWVISFERTEVGQ